MSLIFKSEDHSYHSIDESDTTRWISVTTVTGHFKKAFDAKTQALKSSKNKKSKWYGMTPDQIEQAWLSEGTRSTVLGTYYHDQREADLLSLDTIERKGVIVPIIRPCITDDGVKLAPDQKLLNGIYPEHFVYLKSAGICGQSDLVEVVDGIVDITDYKTNKEIRTEGFKSWDGISQKLGFPVDHLDDCHLNLYALQLSFYMYIILRHNPSLKPGKMVLHHVIFEEDGRDQFDNPINKLSFEGEPIVKEVKPIEIPYLKNEVMSIIKWMDLNRDLIKKNK